MPIPATSERCPACHSRAAYVLDWPFSGLGESVFNTIAAFYACPECGLVYFANIDDITLTRFYTGECTYFCSDHFDANTPENIKKYKVYRALLLESELSEKNILDVGCGRGGFLRWLKKNRWSGQCQGVDADPRSIPKEGIATDDVSFAQGDAFHLPKADCSQDVLTYFHVLEHLRDLDRAMAEATRVLKNDGHLLIEVPDAERYTELPIGTAFWFSIREHVNHFSPTSLERLLRRHGLALLRTERGILPTPEFSYPSLLLVARKSSNSSHAPIATNRSIKSFLECSRSAQSGQAAFISEVMSRYERSVFWGCSAQLFSLLPLLDLSRSNLCDASPLKQGSHYRGVVIQAPPETPACGTALFIAPYLHRLAIRRSALSLGWTKSDIYELE